MILGANQTVDTYRLANTSNTSAFSASKTLDTVDVYLEAASPELRTLIDAQQSLEAYVMHMEPCDIIAGDKVVDSSSVEYRVTSVEKYENNLDTDDLYIVYMNKAASFYSD